MEHSISLLFYIRKSKTTKEGLAPVYVRITVNGNRIDQSLQKFVLVARWDAAAGRVKGNNPEAKELNTFLDAIRAKALKMEREMVQDGVCITLESFREKWFGVHDRPRMLLEIFQEHNNQVTALIGKEFAKATLTRFNTSKDHVSAFLQWKYKIRDIDINRLNFEFVSDYEFWLRTQKNCGHNTTLKYIADLRKVINTCIRKRWLVRDPFIGFKMTRHEVDKDFLTDEELQTIFSKDFETDRLNQVRDVFIFSCFTGLAYADVQKLKRTEVARGIEGDYWVFTKRQKTETASRIPLLPVPLQIIEKYKDHPACINSGKILPIPSNQKMNAYLKEIANISKIHKNLTFHIARHTFATTVTLSNGVPMESVSKMLGHKNLKTTQHYAKILDRKVSDDMKLLREKFTAKENLNKQSKSIG
ncbi:site-specific integrase [Pseudoflavitalea sp. G-6-1-2]|uniref:site-specific integrase n=1 Tax=Pseudoflavitalea sp. G-6-1-2 TaxID=2728841 RepID=UPI001469EF72|nr:site-specific integrase [Pseudoflavitalea sp. G-6-1-2]NML20792.1 site-specific integrase [Pseudoflavitalea sp. G-6-1-2]